METIASENFRKHGRNLRRTGTLPAVLTPKRGRRNLQGSVVAFVLLWIEARRKEELLCDQYVGGRV